MSKLCGSSRSGTFGFLLTRPKCGEGAVSMWVTWMLVQLRLLPDGEHGANMPSLFQFSVCEFDVFNLELTAKSLSLSSTRDAGRPGVVYFEKECNNGYLKKMAEVIEFPGRQAGRQAGHMT